MPSWLVRRPLLDPSLRVVPRSNLRACFVFMSSLAPQPNFHIWGTEGSKKAPYELGGGQVEFKSQLSTLPEVANFAIIESDKLDLLFT